MIASAPAMDMDDPEQLHRGDHRGVLHSAASAGAQVRSVATAVSEGALAAVAGFRPRAMVLVARPGPAAAAVDVAVAALSADLDVPLVHAGGLPEWVGSLDLVVVLGDDAGDPVLSSAVGEALRRGAETVVTTPAEGPVGAAAGTRALALPPRVPVLAAHRFLHHLTAALAVIATARPHKCAQWTGEPDPARGLAGMADLLDGEALADAPGRESFRNPAKTLATSMQGHDVVFAGDTPVTAALARCACTDLLATAGASAAGAALTEILGAPAPGVSGRAAGGPAPDSIFYDEQIDGPRASAPRRVFVFAAAGESDAVRPRMAPLPDGELIQADPGSAAGGGRADAAAPPPIVQCAILAVRWQMAAGYIAVAAQTGADMPQGERA